MYLLMEYFEGMELYQYIKSLTNNAQGLLMDEGQVQPLVLQIARGIKFMQGLGIIHRDLKLSNILIGNDLRTLKIIDFGLAIQLQEMTEERQTLCGTPNYIAPEIITSKPYGLTADLWSLGCISYALFTGTPPFECSTVEETLLRIKSGKFSGLKNVTPSATDFISRLLSEHT